MYSTGSKCVCVHRGAARCVARHFLLAFHSRFRHKQDRCSSYMTVNRSCDDGVSSRLHDLVVSLFPRRVGTDPTCGPRLSGDPAAASEPTPTTSGRVGEPSQSNLQNLKQTSVVRFALHEAQTPDLCPETWCSAGAQRLRPHPVVGHGGAPGVSCALCVWRSCCGSRHAVSHPSSGGVAAHRAGGDPLRVASRTLRGVWRAAQSRGPLGIRYGIWPTV